MVFIEYKCIRSTENVSNRKGRTEKDFTREDSSMRKRLLSLAMALCLILALVPSVSLMASAVNVTGDEFVQYALDNCIGKPYVAGGRSLSGFDCCGLVWYVCNHFGIDVGNGNQNSQRNYGTAVTYSLNSFDAFTKNLKKGDLLFFDYEGDGSSDHVAIYSGDGYAIQAQSPGYYSANIKLTTTWLNGKAEWSFVCSVRRVISEESKIILDPCGGSVKVTSIGINYGDKWSLPTPTLSGYSFDGWYSQKNGKGSKYKSGDTYWGKNETKTIYANWIANTYALECYTNFSGKNYLVGSDFKKLDSKYWKSRDTDVASIAIDTSTTLNGYNSLKIVNTSAGSSGKDLKIITTTQKRGSAVGDNKKMTLSFWAKSAKDGTKMYFRWGYESDYRTVTLTKEWKKYTVAMNKDTTMSDCIYPYVNKAGTVWLSEMQLEDGTKATDFVSESGSLYKSVSTTYGKKYTLPTDPARDGYTFDGWYTSVSGGSKITTSTAVKAEDYKVYAHWTEKEPETYNLFCYNNYSGKNYLMDIGATNLNEAFFQSRDTSISTISLDTETTHNGNNSLKIVNSSAGASGKDLKIITATQRKGTAVGDSKKMTLSFWAKSSAAGTNINFRWGYENDYRTVTLTTEWKKYTVAMNKDTIMSDCIYPYVSKAGTVWMSEMQLEDGAVATEFVAETGGRYDTTKNNEYGKNYTIPADPTRDGYMFDGWYTTPSGGTQVTSNTSVKQANYNVFAHWTKNPVFAPLGEKETVHFEKQNLYYQGQFTDVPEDQWFTISVAAAYELSLMKGNSATTFNPYGDVTIAEAITMAARIHSIYANGEENFQTVGDKWYQVYLDYAYENGIISKEFYSCDVSQKATRAQFAEIFANSLPDNALYPMNNIRDNAVPDVSISEPYAAYVYKLYRAGILTGGDARGTFSPGTYITRAESAAIVSRMAESDNRVAFTLNQ